MSFKIVFMGTPEFAVPSLRMLIENKFDVCAVITQPDRKAGRGHKLMPPPTKVLAQQHGIPVYQFEKVRESEGVALLKELAPDVLITAAFGQILSQEVLDIPRYGCINVHASLLPKLRGAAPIQWAIINGEKKTGITTMFTVLALDAGDILEQSEIEITQNMTAGELYEELSHLGAQTLYRTLEKMQQGTLVRTPQKEEDATYFPMFKKGFGQIDFRLPGQRIVDFIRGTNPVPGAFFMLGQEKIKVFSCRLQQQEKAEHAPGTILYADAKRGLGIQAADGIVMIEQMQRQGAKRMDAKESLRGKTMEIGHQIMGPEESA